MQLTVVARWNDLYYCGHPTVVISKGLILALQLMNAAMSDHLQCSNPKAGIRPLKGDSGRGQHALPCVMAHEFVYNEHLSVSHADRLN